MDLEAQAPIRTAPAAEMPAVTLAAVAARDIAEAASRGVSARQQESIEASWVPVLKHFGLDAAPEAVTFDAIVTYVNARRDAGLRGQSIRKERQAIGRGLRIAKRLGAIAEIPEMPKIANDPKKKEQAGQFREPALVFRFLDALRAIPRSHPAAHQYELVLRTGLRRDEVRRLSLSWVEMLSDGTADVPAVLRVPEWAAKGRAEREVGLTREALALILELADGCDLHEPLCPSRHHKAARKASKMVDSDSITLRDLRHTYATLAGQTGDVKAVQAALGHTSLAMTQRYLHTTRGRAVAASHKAGDALRAAESRTPSPGPPALEGQTGNGYGPSRTKSEGAVMSGRGGQIRTDDHLLPKQVRYRAALHPERRTLNRIARTRHGSG